MNSFANAAFIDTTHCIDGTRERPMTLDMML